MTYTAPFIGFGDLHGPKPYKFIGFGDVSEPVSHPLLVPTASSLGIVDVDSALSFGPDPVPEGTVRQ